MNTCSKCKHYEVLVSRLVGYENSQNKPDSEGRCLKLSGDDDCPGILSNINEHYDGVMVTSNFGCILFEK